MSIGGGSSGRTQQVVQTNAPPDYLKPQLEFAAKEAQKIYQEKPTQVYAGQTYANFAPETEAALQAQAGRATAGNPLVDAAQGTALRTVQGDFLNRGNPEADAAFANIAQKIRQGTDATFARSGRTGSGAAANALTSATGQAATDFYGKLYEAERGRQQQALTYAPSLAAEDYRDIAALNEVGTARQGQDQARISDDIARYNAQFELPRSDLGTFISSLGGANFGGTTTSQQPIYSNNTGNILGTGLAAASLASRLFGQGGFFGR